MAADVEDSVQFLEHRRRAESKIDYLRLSRWNDEWKIVNVLWELLSPEK